ncbi:MAG: hypothetical protein ACTSVM_04030 [Candidatus Ranarchaeia archaeon]
MQSPDLISMAIGAVFGVTLTLVLETIYRVIDTSIKKTRLIDVASRMNLQWSSSSFPCSSGSNKGQHYSSIGKGKREKRLEKGYSLHTLFYSGGRGAPVTGTERQKLVSRLRKLNKRLFDEELLNSPRAYRVLVETMALLQQRLNELEEKEKGNSRRPMLL